MSTEKDSILTPLLLSLDNGKYIRSLGKQVEIVGKILPIKNYFTFHTPRHLLAHTAIICYVS